MKYCIIKESSDENIVGKDYPQTCNFIKGYNPDAPQALYSLYDYRAEFPNYVPELDGFKLSGSAKLTDFVSSIFSWSLFVISQRVKVVFEQHKLCPHRFYPLGLYKRNVKFNYFMLSIISDYSTCVDYKNSTFAEYNILNSRWKNLVLIDSREEYVRKRDRLKQDKGLEWALWSDHIVMNSSFDRELDFFSIGKLDSHIYVSERLKEEIEFCGLTGWEFLPADHIIVT